MGGPGMQHGAGLGAAAGFLAMWMAMMVPMMLPSLVPMLSRYRRSARGAGRSRLHRLTALAGLGYYAVWAGLGLAVYAAGVAWETMAGQLPGGGGMVLLAAGMVQITAWKARQLERCREGPGCGPSIPPFASGAWRHGLELGVRCSLCCGSLMVAMLALGMMHPAVIALITLAIAAERLGPAPLRVARATGAGMVAAGVLVLAGA